MEKNIDLNFWEKAKIVIGKIIKAGIVKNKNKLCKLQVVLGVKTTKQIITDLVSCFKEKDLLAKLIITLANLSFTKLAGEIFKEMLLTTEKRRLKMCSVSN